MWERSSPSSNTWTFISGYSAAKLGDLPAAERAVERGVDVRGLVWRSHPTWLAGTARQNRRLVRTVNAAGGEFLLDHRVRALGSHHQKFVVVDDKLSFLGGLDLCDHRWDTTQHKNKNPLRVSRGEPVKAAQDLARVRDGEVVQPGQPLYRIADLDTRSEHWLGQQGRITHPMVKRPGGTHYEPITWSDAYDLVVNGNELASGSVRIHDAALQERVFETLGMSREEARERFGFFLEAFALLGGERPGYEFFPSPKDGYYTLQIDTPGEWQFALFAVRTESLGKIDRGRQPSAAPQEPGQVVAELAGAVAPSVHFVEDVAPRPHALGSARIRHNAEGAEFVAALDDGHVGLQ